MIDLTLIPFSKKQIAYNMYEIDLIIDRLNISIVS